MLPPLTCYQARATGGALVGRSTTTRTMPMDPSHQSGDEPRQLQLHCTYLALGHTNTTTRPPAAHSHLHSCICTNNLLPPLRRCHTTFATVAGAMSLQRASAETLFAVPCSLPEGWESTRTPVIRCWAGNPLQMWGLDRLLLGGYKLRKSQTLALFAWTPPTTLAPVASQRQLPRHWTFAFGSGRQRRLL